MGEATGEAEGTGLRVAFDRRLKVEFHGATVTSDAGLLAFRELDDALGLTATAGEVFADPRTGRNGRHSAGVQPCQLPPPLALPGEIAQWSLTSLREKVVKIGAKVLAHGRYLVFQMAEVAVPRALFRQLLDRIASLRPPAVARC